MSNSSFVLLGRITRPHGIRGEVFVQYFAESYAHLKQDYIQFRLNNTTKNLTIQSFKEQKNLLIVKIQGINNRNDAELLRNYEIVMDEKHLFNADHNSNEDCSDDMLAQEQENDFDDSEGPFLHQILNKKAVLADNTELGIITHIQFPAGQELWSIEHASGAEILFPAVSDFIDSYDLENGRIVLNPPEGLIELYLSPNEENPTT